MPEALVEIEIFCFANLVTGICQSKWYNGVQIAQKSFSAFQGNEEVTTTAKKKKRKVPIGGKIEKPKEKMQLKYFEHTTHNRTSAFLFVVLAEYFILYPKNYFVLKGVHDVSSSRFSLSIVHIYL